MFETFKTSKPWEGIRVNFIVSTGRTGTKFLAHFFNGFGHIESHHEPEPNFLVLGNRFATGKISFDAAARELARGRKHLANSMRRSAKSVYIESNNMLYSLVPVLGSVFENFKIVHVVRDGRDVVRSGMHRPWYTDSDHLPRIKATDFDGDPFSNEWERMDRFEKVCWWWQKRDRIISDALENHDNSITVRFEEIFDSENGNPGMRKIIDFLELDIEYQGSDFFRKINETGYSHFPHWRAWDRRLREKFTRVAGDQAARHGYIDKEAFPDTPQEKIDMGFYNHYAGISYDTKERFCSYWHQIDEILGLKPKKLLEIGIGNGFVSEYLRKKRIDLVTLDMEKQLGPNVAGSIMNLPFKSQAFDVVACFELLEHLPYDDLPKALAEIRRITDSYAVLSVPDVTTVYRIDLELPRMQQRIRKLITHPFHRPVHHVFTGEHYWEIGKKGYSLDTVSGGISAAGFRIVKTYRVFEHYYHRFFIVEKL